MAATADVDADYWSVVVVSMSLMAAGMALATEPGHRLHPGLPAAGQAGVGSAVNDTVRELGGALGVAVVGSVMSWSYRGALADRWADLGLPTSLVSAGQSSVGSGLAVAEHAPPAQIEPVVQAVRLSFMDGLHAGSLTAAAAAFVAGLAALLFLPHRDRPRQDEAEEPDRELAARETR